MIEQKRWPLGVALLGMLLLLGACGDDGSDSPNPGNGGEDAGSGGGTDGGEPDGSGSDAGETDGGGGQIVDETLLVVFTREVTVPEDPENEYTQLMIADTDCRAPSTQVCGDPGSCPLREIAPRYPDEPLCEVSCGVTPTMGHVVFLDPTDPRTLRYAPLGDDYQLAADSEVLASEVTDYELSGTFVAYRVGARVSLFNLETGEDRFIAEFQNNGGGFHLTPDGETLFVNTVTSLSSMEMEFYPTSGEPGQFVYQFISGELQGTGSAFDGQEPMAVAPDGTRLAIITEQRNSYAPCATSDDCTGVGQQCLTSASPPRCVATQLTLHVIDLSEEGRGRLGTLCTDNASCGADQFCDLTAPDSSGQGRCLPVRFVLGPTGPGACDFFAAGDYTEARAGLAWRDNETVVALLGHDCLETNIPITNVVAFGLSGEAFQDIEINPGENHGQCFNEVDNCTEVEECNVEIENMRVSPEGSTIVMVADSPQTPGKNELWLVDGFARFPKQLLTTSILYEVLTASLHTPR